MNPQSYRFLVRSADEAVTLLREKFGPNARVVSVRQVEGKGLSRFLSAPKLEVTAEVTATIGDRIERTHAHAGAGARAWLP